MTSVVTVSGSCASSSQAVISAAVCKGADPRLISPVSAGRGVLSPPRTVVEIVSSEPRATTPALSGARARDAGAGVADGDGVVVEVVITDDSGTTADAGARVVTAIARPIPRAARKRPGRRRTRRRWLLRTPAGGAATPVGAPKGAGDTSHPGGWPSTGRTRGTGPDSRALTFEAPGEPPRSPVLCVRGFAESAG